MTYYVSRMVSDSIRSGEEFGIMSKSIVIAICDFVLFTETSEFKNNFYFMEEQEHFKLTDICKIITLELPKVPKTNDTNKLIQWLRFIKSETKTEAESMLKTDADFKKAWEELEEINGDPELRWEYTSRLLNIMGQQQMRIDAEEMEKALQKADLELEQLHEEIFSATEELNLVKAEAASAKAEADSAKAEADSAKAEADSAKAEALQIKMNTAIQLKQINLPIEQISQITGLSKEKISTL